MFIDESWIDAVSGKGGDGCVAFRREKYVPHGGPAGGNGGKGGSVILIASKDLHTLYDIGDRRIFKAENGVPGGSDNCTGKEGKDLIIKVPLGTLVKDFETKELLADLVLEGDSFVAGQGGKGGLGNTVFRSSTNQAPRKFTLGNPGDRRKLSLELRLLADCALVGFPNAGKSSIIRKLSAATPKVADYPFTTLKPVLGLVNLGQGRSFVLVDVPGLIEGAAEGKGLGHQFLKHIERTHALAFVLDPGEGDVREQMRVLLSELERWHPALLDKPRIIIVNKADLGVEFEPPVELGPVMLTSAVTGEGLSAFAEAAWTIVEPMRTPVDPWTGK